MIGSLSPGVGPGTAVVIVAAAAAFVTFAVRRTRPTPRGRARRLVALSAVAVGLIGVGLRPHRVRTVVSGIVLLETDGAPSSALDSLAAVYRGAIRVSTRDSTARVGRALRDAGMAAVAGYGLDEDDWSGFTGSVAFVPPVLPDGISRLFWEREVTLGASLVVEGHARWSDSTLVSLVGPGGVDDSTWVQPGESAFRLRARPRDAGRLVYVLRVGREGDAREIGTTIVPPHPRRVLILEHRPRFTTRHLKGWLGERGGAVMIRTRISRDRYRTEFVNHVRVSLDRVAAGVLETLDAVIADAASLAALSAGERGALRAAIERDGLGLLVLPDASPEPARENAFLSDFVVLRDPDLEDLTATPRWVGLDAEPLPSVPAVARAVTSGPSARPIVWDGSDRAIAAVARRGAGHVALSLVAEPERWVLRGREDAFSDYWVHVLGAAMQGRTADRWSVASDGPVFRDGTVVLDLVTAAPRPMATVIPPSGGEEPLPLVQDTVHASRWRGLYRPRAVGWHVARGEQGDFAFHVTARDGWATWDAARRIDATARRAAAPVTTDRRTRQAALPMSLVWFWLAVLTGAGYLWAEGKLLP